MKTVSSYMAEAHSHCDELFTNAENLAAKAKWGELNTAFQKFVTETEKHFSKEQDVLFPRVEQMMGSGGGPTQVMRMEHDQMRMLIENMTGQIKAEDQAEFLGEAETLLIMMQQHNMKEEQMLYPMIDRAIGPDAESVIQNLEQI